MAHDQETFKSDTLRTSGISVVVLGTRGFPGIQGGVERHCEQLYPLLVSMGCKVTVMARAGYAGKKAYQYKGVGVLPIWAPGVKSLEAIVHTFLGIIHIARNREKYDIAHIHGIGPSLLVPMVKLSGLKVVMTNHGPDYERKKWGNIAKTMLKLGERLGVKTASSVIVVSRMLRDYVNEKYKINAHYIPNGVTISGRACGDDIVERYGLVKGKYILAVGRFVPEKGFHDLLSAFKTFDTDWKLAIAGGADHDDEYSRSIVKTASDNPKVVLTGVLKGDDMVDCYSNAGIFILPSYYEGLPLAVLEAMGYGLPILASDIPANRELIDNPECLFPPGDIEAIRKKLADFMNNTASPEMARHNKEKVVREYNWEKIAGKTLDVYKKSLAK